MIALAINTGIVEHVAGESVAYRMAKYDINLIIPETFDRIEVEALLCLERMAPESESVVAIMLGENFRGASVTNVEVSDVDNMPVDFTIDGTLLRVVLSDTSGQDTFIWLVIEYDLTKDEEFYDEYSPFSFELSDSLCHINASITRTDNWYPKIKGTMAQRLPPYELTIDVPSKFEVMASGRLIDVVDEGDRRCYKWQNYEGITDRSLYFFAQEMRTLVKEYRDGFKIIMYLPDNAREENIQYVADVIHKSYRFFEKTYGAVPWNEYKIMAFTYGYSGLFNSMTAPKSLFTSEIINNEIYHPIRVVIHEVSHTWWGNVVSSNADENYWLYEGFGKFSEVAGIKSALDVDVETLSFFRLKLCTLPYIDYVPAVLDAQDSDDRVMVNVAAYYMGATYLRMLKFVIGEKGFYKGIQAYVKQCWGKCISTTDFLAIMKRHCKVIYHAMLSDYIINPGYARYDIKILGTLYNGKHYIHNYEVINVGDKDIFTPYRVQSDMESYTKNLFLRKEDRVVIQVKSNEKATVDHIKIDPEEIYPVCRCGLKGPGAIVYQDQQGDVKIYNVAADAPFARAGITENMTLLELDSKDLSGNELHTLNHMFLRTEGTKIELLVQAADEEPQQVTVVY